MNHAMTVGAQNGEVHARIEFNNLPFELGDRREVMRLDEIFANGTVRSLKVKTARFAFIAVNHLRLMGKLSIAFNSLVFPQRL